MFNDLGKLLFTLSVGMGTRPTHHRINWANDGWAAEDDRLVNQGGDVGCGSLLFFGSAAKVAAWPHASTDATDH